MWKLIEVVFTNPIVAFIILVGVVVFVHELGHYLAGRLVGVDVEEFSLGFGPKAFGFKKGLTEFKVGWLPLGGYVRFYGSEIGAEIPRERRHRALLTSRVYKRATISLAGPAANFVLSLCVMIGLSAWGMPAPAPVVAVVPGLAAERAGLRDGDRVLSIAGEPVATWADLNRVVTGGAGKSLLFVVDRAGSPASISVTPVEEETQGPFGDRIRVGRIGVTQFFPGRVLSVRAGSLGAALGLRSGDEALSVGGKPVTFAYEVEAAFARAALNPEAEFSLSVRRDGATLEIPIAGPSVVDVVRAAGGEASEGLAPVSFSELTIAPLAAAGALAKGDPRQASLDAWKACGLSDGDTLVSLGSTGPLRNPVQIAAFLEKSGEGATAGEPIVVPVRAFAAGAPVRSFTCTVPAREAKDALGRPARVLDFPFKFAGKGVPVEPVVVKSAGPVAAIADGGKATAAQASTIFTGLRKLVTGGLPLSNLGGPIAIARVAGDAAEGGMLLFILTVSWMSINIGMFNLLPLPALDGGSLLLQGVEAAYGRPLPVHVQATVQKAGVVLILLLFVLVFYNDILRLFMHS